MPAKEPPAPANLLKDIEKYPWSFRVTNARFFLNEPIVIDGTLRATMEAFENRDQNGSWSWLVQGTRSLTEHNFMLVTGNDPVR